MLTHTHCSNAKHVHKHTLLHKQSRYLTGCSPSISQAMDYAALAAARSAAGTDSLTIYQAAMAAAATAACLNMLEASAPARMEHAVAAAARAVGLPHAQAAALAATSIEQVMASLTQTAHPGILPIALAAAAVAHTCTLLPGTMPLLEPILEEPGTDADLTSSTHPLTGLERLVKSSEGPTANPLRMSHVSVRLDASTSGGVVPPNSRQPTVLEGSGSENRSRGEGSESEEERDEEEERVAAIMQSVQASAAAAVSLGMAANLGLAPAAAAAVAAARLAGHSHSEAPIHAGGQARCTD
jgi:hypothetical protein